MVSLVNGASLDRVALHVVLVLTQGSVSVTTPRHNMVVLCVRGQPRNKDHAI